ALIASGFIVLFQFILFLFVGVLLFVFSQHVPLFAAGQRTDAILPTFLVREMSIGFVGILLVSILAVAMSNASGSLNSLAASTVLDFSRLSGHQTDSVKFLKLSRRITLVWGAVLICFGLVSWGPLLEAGLTVASLPFGSLLGLFLLGILDKRAIAIGATVGMFAGFAVILSVWRFTPVAFTWYVLIGSAVTFFVGSLMSRILPAST